MRVWTFTTFLVIAMVLTTPSVQGKGKTIMTVQELRQQPSSKLTPDEKAALERCALNWARQVGESCRTAEESQRDLSEYVRRNGQPSFDQSLKLLKQVLETTCAEPATCSAIDKICECPPSQSCVPHNRSPSKECDDLLERSLKKAVGLGTVFGPQFQSMILTTAVLVYLY